VIIVDSLTKNTIVKLFSD